MSSTTADTSPESVGSCRPPTPPTSLPPHSAPAAALRGAPVRRQLDFADADADSCAGAGGDLDDYDDFLIRAVDDIERGYNEAKRRAPPCVCGRGYCAVQRDDQSGGWMYVCSSQPKCKHVAMCKEVDQNPQSPPVVRSDPKTSNRCAFNVPRTPVNDARTQINNVTLEGAGATTPINVSPQAAVAATPFSYTSKGVGAMTPVHVSPQGAGATTPINVSPQAAVAATPFSYTLKGVGAMTPVHVSPQGKCKILRVGNEDWYVCPIPKGQGACSYKVPVTDAVGAGDNDDANGSANPAQPNDDEWPFDVINDEIVPTPRAVAQQKSPSTPHHQRSGTARTPAPSPVTPFGSRGAMTGRPNDTCFGCGEKGHWISACPKPSPRSRCFRCGVVGHRPANCPQPRGS
uniref:CCHC-type domain-containing protein n=1 Tax=Zea mays TaxID=4577 RepID=A0A804NZI3_MAIZE